MQLTPQQQLHLERLSKVLDGGNIALLQYINELDTKVENGLKELQRVTDELTTALNSIDVEDGHTPTEDELTSLISPLIPEVEDGKDYVLTTEDKVEIADMAATLVKTIEIEKVIEIQKTETIHETPIVTENVVQVAMKDTATETRDKLETLKGDERLDVSAIKGLGKKNELLTNDIINRAIGIVDQRTSFLINKVSALKEQVDILLSSSSSGFQTPLTGAVDEVNTTFTWTTAPNVIVVDGGRAMQRVSSDGTENWTGTTTTILLIAPNFDIFATN